MIVEILKSGKYFAGLLFPNADEVKHWCIDLYTGSDEDNGNWTMVFHTGQIPKVREPAYCRIRPEVQ